MFAFAAVNDAVSTILAHARSDEVKADEIVGGIMKHRLLEGHLASFNETKEQTRNNRLSDDIITELLKSISTLKNGARNTPEWIAYRCILNAIIPADCKHPKAMANFIGAHYHTVKSASKRKKLISKDGDWALGTLADLRKDTFAIKYKEHVKVILSFYEAETQASPSEMKMKHKHNNHRNKNHRRVCIDDSLCTSHVKHFQTCSDQTMYERFACVHGDIAEVCSATTFKTFRPYWVVAPTPRTCVCIHCSNFYLKHDVYVKLRAEMEVAVVGNGNGNASSGQGEDTDTDLTADDPTVAAIKTADDVAAQLFCAKKGGSKYYNVDCVEGDCEGCGWDSRSFECGMCKDQSTPAQWRVQKNVRVDQANDTHADIADAYGEYQGEKTILQKVTGSGTLAEFMASYKAECKDFFRHRELHHHQADSFIDCIDNLPQHHITLLIDYNMNYSHNHPDSTQGEHWSHMQTTLVPVIIYVREMNQDGTKGRVNAISEIVLSEDLNHSNQMIQHIIKKMVRKYKHIDPLLSHCHIWSDGCGSQLKNRWQMWFLSQRYMGLCYSHNFFASCHG